MTGCGAMVVCLLLVGAAGPKARTGLLRADDPRVGACPLVGGAGSWGLWLQGPEGLRSSACAPVCGAESWALWWIGPYPGVAVVSACLLVGGAVSPPS